MKFKKGKPIQKLLQRLDEIQNVWKNGCITAECHKVFGQVGEEGSGTLKNR